MSLAETVQCVDQKNTMQTYEDLREWLDIVESIGELKRIKGADWNLEIGTLAELISRERSGIIPALLFDRIRGYPEGFRILFGQHCSYQRLALALGLPLDSIGLKLVDRFRKKLSTLQPLSPRVVTGGPVLENQLVGGEIDLLKFPVPFIHELDGGRFIGTACVAITRDPEEGWLNLGTYRTRCMTVIRWDYLPRPSQNMPACIWRNILAGVNHVLLLCAWGKIPYFW